MNWASALILQSSTVNTIVILGLVIALGSLFGKIRFWGISFGIGGVMFAGLVFGHYHLGLHHREVLHFVREFGLVLFVYTIGIEIGPGFFHAFRQHGLRLNALAVSLVLLGFGCAVLVLKVSGLHIATVVGIMSGAVTNTPGLGAAQQVLGERFADQPDILDLPALAYAITYPFGILGVILSMVVARTVFRIDLGRELHQFSQAGFEDRSRILTSNQNRHQDEPNSIAALFLGILLGLIVGAIPIPIPGIPSPLHLGTAGGPLLVALSLGYFRRIGPMRWQLDRQTNHTIREIGIGLFLAVVGLTAGHRFVDSLLTSAGWQWLLAGMIITLIPPMVVILVARLVFRENFLSICGLTAGSMTDPPALAFAIQSTASNAPAQVFATVYAVTMFLRVICAQLLVILFSG